MLCLGLFVPFCLVVYKAGCFVVPPGNDLERVTQLIFRPNEVVDQLYGKSKPEFAEFVNGQPHLYDKMVFHGELLASKFLSDAREEHAPHVTGALRGFRSLRLAQNVDPQTQAKILRTHQDAFYSRLRDITAEYPEQFPNRVTQAKTYLTEQLFALLQTGSLTSARPVGKPEEIHSWLLKWEEMAKRSREQFSQKHPELSPVKVAKVDFEPVRYLTQDEVRKSLEQHEYHLIPSSINQPVPEEATSHKSGAGEKQLPPFGSSQRLTDSQKPHPSFDRQATQSVPAVAAAA